MINPSPKGKKGVGKGISLNHSRPKGLVGFPKVLEIFMLGLANGEEGRREFQFELDLLSACVDT